MTAKLTAWFALHVLFAHFTPWRVGPAHLNAPALTSFQPWPALLAVIAGLLLFRLRLGVVTVLSIPVVLAMGLFALGLP